MSSVDMTNGYTSGYSSDSSGLADLRSRVCAVCKVDTNSFNQNYGANSCLSCRAFFRRIIQQKSSAKLKCRGNSELALCEIRPETRKRCKRCRFDACVRAGMRSESVLNEDQYKRRFRKLIRKQKGGRSSSGDKNEKMRNVEESDSDDEDEELNAFLESVSKATFFPDLLSTETSVALPKLNDVRLENGLEIPLLTIDNCFMEIAYDEQEEKIDKKSFNVKQRITQQEIIQTSDVNYFNFVSRARSTWHEACRQVRIQTDFSRYLLSLHAGNHTNSFSKTVFKNHLNTLADFFRTFALKQPEFTCLSASDQRELLKRNTRLFIQYFLGRYFYAGSGYKQQQWILLCQVPDYLSESSYVRFIPLMTLDGMINLFRKRQDLENYANYAQKLSELTLNFNCNCAVTLICLFSSDETTKLSGRASITRTLEFVYDCAGWSMGKFDCGNKEELSSIANILVAMAATFDCSVDWQDDKIPLILENPIDEIRVQSTEECFFHLLQRMKSVSEFFPFGGDIVQEIVMFNLEVPVSKRFLQNTVKVWEERFCSVLRVYIKDDEMVELAERNVQRSVALALIRHDTCKDGLQQIQHALGSFDFDLLNHQLSQINSEKSVKKIRFQDIIGVVGITPEQLQTYACCNSILSAFVEYEELYRIFCIVTLFQDINPELLPLSFSLEKRADYINDKMKLYYPFSKKNWFSEFSKNTYLLSDCAKIFQ